MTEYYSPPELRLSDDIAFEHHGAAILYLVREKRVRNWAGLCRAFRYDPAQNHSGHYGLRTTLRELFHAGLVTGARGLSGPYQVGPQAEEVLAALDISLTEAANLTRHQGMAVRPLFGARPELVLRAHLFVLMPFRDEFSAVYAAIRTTASKMRLRVERADDIHSARSVMDDIWGGICNSGMVIADCTGRNPNVFYEIGIAHTVGRDVVLLTQDLADIPFDVAHMRFIHYKPTAAGLKKLSTALRKTIAAVKADGWTA